MHIAYVCNPTLKEKLETQHNELAKIRQMHESKKCKQQKQPIYAYANNDRWYFALSNSLHLNSLFL